LKSFFIFIILISSLFADTETYLYQTDNICVYDVAEDVVGYEYKKSSDDSQQRDMGAEESDFLNGYTYYPDTDECLKNKLLNDIAKATGLTLEEVSYQFAIMGNLIGFSFLFITLFITVLISRR